MNTAIFNDMITLVENVEALVQALEEAREALTDEQFDEALDGPFGEILSAAMDVEGAMEEF